MSSHEPTRSQPGTSRPVTPLLELRGLIKHYGGLPAVDGIDLEVAVGEVVAVIGPNGAGKSTLLALINGMIAPADGGSVLLDGAQLCGARPHRIRRAGIATVLQTPRMFESLSVVDNVALGAVFAGPRQNRLAARRTAMDVLRRVGLDDRPGVSIGALTLHERRLVDLARALAGRPRVVLLDEVMAGLNPTEVDGFVRVIRRLRDELGIAVIWVEHVMRAVTDLADRVVVMHVGRELAQGTAAEVMRHPQVIEAYLGHRGDGHVAG